jgi:pimeloyl-ACP methyl ester carboxylesterase
MSDPVDEVMTLRRGVVRVQQAGAGAPLLFLHGAGGRNWTPLHKALAKSYRVIAPEHPGFGGSPIPPWMNSVGDLAMFYLDLIEHMGLTGVHLAGHSLGGWTAGDDDTPGRAWARWAAAAGAKECLTTRMSAAIRSSSRRLRTKAAGSVPSVCS